jgi:AcrR family transcriptional regulator
MNVHTQAPKTRREKEYLAHRGEILRAAERLFAGRGFHGATMADLAHVSEFSVGTLYKFFKSKEEVYYLLILEKLDFFHSRLEAELKQSPPGLNQIRVLIASSLSFFQENQDFFKILILERANLESSVGATLARELRKKSLATIEIFRRVLGKAIKMRAIQKLDAHDLAIALQGILSSFAIHWAYDQHSEEPLSKASFIYELFLGGVNIR